MGNLLQTRTNSGYHVGSWVGTRMMWRVTIHGAFNYLIEIINLLNIQAIIEVLDNQALTLDTKD
jgi:hypothetical protein